METRDNWNVNLAKREYRGEWEGNSNAENWSTIFREGQPKYMKIRDSEVLRGGCVKSRAGNFNKKGMGNSSSSVWRTPESEKRRGFQSHPIVDPSHFKAGGVLRREGKRVE